MTENEAISRIKDHMEIHRLKEPRAIYITVALSMAITALKEIQQYREIETVEYFKKLKLADNGTIWGFIDEYVAYKNIGTVEECREAVEKQKPEKPEIYTDTIQTISSSFNRGVYLCSRCGHFIGNIDDELPRYCNCCGQRIDENLEGMEDE